MIYLPSSSMIPEQRCVTTSKKKKTLRHSLLTNYQRPRVPCCAWAKAGEGGRREGDAAWMARARDAPEPPPLPAVRGEEGRGLDVEGDERRAAPGDVGTKRPGGGGGLA
jgi:hypothetical protein